MEQHKSAPAARRAIAPPAEEENESNGERKRIKYAPIHPLDDPKAPTRTVNGLLVVNPETIKPKDIIGINKLVDGEVPLGDPGAELLADNARDLKKEGKGGSQKKSADNDETAKAKAAEAEKKAKQKEEDDKVAAEKKAQEDAEKAKA